ncbi:hypothetical protein Tco_1417626 [Tanacetum coccineum]
MILQTNTKTLEDLCSQSLKTASQAIHDVVTTHPVTASARTNSNADIEDSFYDGVTIKTRCSDGNLRELSGEEAWETIENYAQDPQSTPQVLPSSKEYTPPATYPEEVEETLGIPIKVEPLDETPLEDLGLKTCNHDIPLSSKEIPSINESEPQPQPLPNCLSLDVSLGEERGPEPPIKPHSPDSFRMKEVDRLTINIPPSPHMASSYPKDTYCYYRLCIDDPKKHYGFKPGLLGKSASLGKELSLFDRPNEVERGRIPEAHRLESILQQQISQHMAPSHHDDRKAHLLEDKQIPSVGVFDEVYFSFGRHLDELHVTWAHLEKKRTRLQTNTKTLEDLCSQSLKTVLQAIHDAVTTHPVTASHISRRRQSVPTQTQI